MSWPPMCTGVIGQIITGLGRRGKYLILPLSGGQTLIAHLKMSGALILAPEGSEIPYTRAVLHLDQGGAIYFRDPRRFGRLWLVGDPETVVGKLGPEPFAADFTAARLAERLRRHKMPLKAVLLDQTVLAGVGNMYADEALFKARLHPLRTPQSLSHGELGRLHRAIRHVLRQGIKNKGASTENYLRPDGTVGKAHEDFKVAHRRGANCPVCSGPLAYLKVRGRGTYFCPSCQKPG
jgi:formamidopyrimidine-DNA glycosylase